MHKFAIEDEAHSESLNTHTSLKEAIAELYRLSLIAWDKEPNRAPCSNWKNCGRSYAIIEYDVSQDPWIAIRRIPALKISADAILWTPVIRELSSKSNPIPKDSMSKKFSDVRNILMHDWDPIGVSEAVEAQDEYDDYVSQIISMMSQGASVDDVAEHLIRVTRDFIEINTPDREKALQISEKIFELLK